MNALHIFKCYGLFALYAAGSVALGISATALGFWLAK